MFVYRESMSSVMRNASLGILVWLNVRNRSVKFLMYNLVAFMWGCKNLSNRAEAVYVGPLVQDTMGRSLIGHLCNFGRKYMDCVDTSTGRYSVLNCWFVIAPLALQFLNYWLNLLTTSNVGSSFSMV